MNDYSYVGSFLHLNDETCVNFYKRSDSLKKYSENEVTAEWQIKRKKALEDAEYLKKFNTTPKEEGEKLFNIVKKQLVNEKIENREDWSNYMRKNNNQAPKLSSSLEKEHDERIADEQPDVICPFCKREFKDITYRIVHKKTNQSLSFTETTLHLVREHEYFAIHKDFRLEPANVCKFFGYVGNKK